MHRKVALLLVSVFIPSVFISTEIQAQFGFFESQTSAQNEKAKTMEGTKEMALVGSPAIQVGRFAIVFPPNNGASLMLLDTATGCVWSQVENTETKRMTFVEVDVENLHWSYGSGAQQLLAERIEASTLTPEQKKALKEELRKTGCGLSSNLVLTPGKRNSGQ